MKVRDLIARLAAYDPDQQVLIALQCTTLNELNNPIDHDNLRDFLIDGVDVGPTKDQPTVAIYATDIYHNHNDEEIEAFDWHHAHPTWHAEVITEPLPKRLETQERARILADALDAIRRAR